MIGPQRLLIDSQGAEVDGLGLGVGTLVPVELREVVEAGGGRRVIGPQALFRPGEFFFLNPGRLLIVALLKQGLHLSLPLLNLRWIGAAALSAGLGQ